MKNILIGSAVLGFVVVGVTGLGSPAMAQEELKTEEKVERHVIVKRAGKDGEKHARGRHFAVTRGECKGEKVESDIAVGDEGDKHRTRIVICGKGENSAELNKRLVEALEKARGRVGEHEGLSAERRAELKAKIEGEIARLRAGGN